MRLAALKREEDALQRERETLEAAKLAHIKCDLHSMRTLRLVNLTNPHNALCGVDGPSQCVSAVQLGTRCSASTNRLRHL